MIQTWVGCRHAHMHKQRGDRGRSKTYSARGSGRILGQIIYWTNWSRLFLSGDESRICSIDDVQSPAVQRPTGSMGLEWPKTTVRNDVMGCRPGKACQPAEGPSGHPWAERPVGPDNCRPDLILGQQAYRLDNAHNVSPCGVNKKKENLFMWRSSIFLGHHACRKPTWTTPILSVGRSPVGRLATSFTILSNGVQFLQLSVEIILFQKNDYTPILTKK